MNPPQVLITGGGTGGHVYPALALGEELVRRGHERGAIHYVGAARGLEATAVPAAGFPVELLPGRGFQRRATPRALFANLGTAAATVVAFVRAWWILSRIRPSVVVGVGGYASLPCVVAARLRRIPVVVHEQNLAPGVANRIAVRLGARAAVALAGTPLRGAVIVGNPVRGAVFEIERRPDPSRPLVLVSGGSLGARTINAAVVGLAFRWRDRADLRIRHVAGVRNVDACTVALAALRGPADRLEYTLVDYEERMDEWYAQASVAVCRAGAITVAELAAAGVPAVLVPLPGAPADHQTANAEALADVGAAVVIADAECTTDRLGEELEGLLGDPERLAAMGAGARTLAQPDAAGRLADLVEDAARNRHA
ncbi:MAG TPA: undecaprenyldiphospho-muramoylpentapeptide beta-N-acetylglucosaminyltransferase [Acidimicrobiia bacterium]|nr:undecaprenyldiphospho-muramoylpentapeptide beta-N-acetylglucosaminyltransferase [Acidimicrobiia bacterium]